MQFSRVMIGGLKIIFKLDLQLPQSMNQNVYNETKHKLNYCYFRVSMNHFRETVVNFLFFQELRLSTNDYLKMCTH